MSTRSWFMKFIDKVPVWLRELARMLWVFVWAWPKRSWRILRPARAAFWFAIVFCIGALASDQVADVLTAIASEPMLTARGNYLLAAGLLAFSLTLWYWARAVLYVWYEFTPGYEHRPPTIEVPSTGALYRAARTLKLIRVARNLGLIEEKPDESSESSKAAWDEANNVARDTEATRKWAARWIGLLPILFIAIDFAFLEHWSHAFFYAVLSAAFLLFMILRRDWVLYKMEGKPWAVNLHPSLPSGTLKTLSVWGVAFVIIVALALLWKVAFPQAAGPFAILLLTMSPLVAFFTALAYIKDRNTQFPSPTFLVLLGVVIVGLWNDNHMIRLLPGSDATAGADAFDGESRDSWRPDDRPDIATHFENWLKYRLPSRTDDAPVTASKYAVFVVAAEGGGIRAAYWTAAVLESLQESSQGRFGCHLFAISGVSGGSLGGAAFVAELANAAGVEEQGCGSNRPQSEPGPTDARWQGVALKFLGKDFLSPTLAGMMTSDLLSRINPACVPDLGFTALCIRDRGFYLELGWETGWDDVVKQKNLDARFRFSDPFHALWAVENRKTSVRLDLPSLFLNGTWVETGSRNVTSNLRTDAGRDPLVASEDVLEELGQPIRFSTAVLNSARFTYVSPPGTARLDDGTRRIVDGGYFENSGALTAREIVRAIRSQQPNVPVVALIITNNPKRGVETWRDDGEQLCESPDYAKSVDDDDQRSGDLSWRFLTEALSPVTAMLDAREARGRLAEKELIATNGAERTFRFPLRSAKGVALPLGWALSNQAQQEMKDQAKDAATACYSKLLAVLE